MATNCLIARENRDGSFDAIYVHFGHPGYVGGMLTRHYADGAKIARLLELGALSQLGEEIGRKQSFNQPHPDWCLAYERDRGDDPNPAIHVEALIDLVEHARRLFIGHVFVWRWEMRVWAMVRMPKETEESVQAIVDEMVGILEGKGQPAPLGLDAYSDLHE
jgi:hypothetical protein